VHRIESGGYMSNDAPAVGDPSNAVDEEDAAASAAPSTASAVVGMTVPEVRAALAILRHMWSCHSPVYPIYASTLLVEGMSASEFAFHFVLGHHRKRHRRCTG